MNDKLKAKKIYVTVGWKNSNIPMGNKIGCWILPDDSLTEIQIAKKIRKQFADHPEHHGYTKDTKPFKPSDLYWAIFDDLYATKSRICSDNWREGEIIVNNPSEISNRSGDL